MVAVTVVSVLIGQQLVSASSSGWTATGSLPRFDYITQSVLLSNGKVLATGRINNPSSTGPFAPTRSYLYDAKTGTWSETAPMKLRWTAPDLVPLSDGKVLAVSDETPRTEVYDPQSGRWSLSGKVASIYSFFGFNVVSSTTRGALAIGDEFDCAKGCQAPVFRYHERSGKWTRAGSSNYLFSGSGVTELKNGNVLIAGGEACDENDVCTLDRGMVYHAASRKWTWTKQMPYRSSGPSSTLLKNGSVLIDGGFQQNQDIGYSVRLLKEAEIYHPATNSWTPTGKMVQARGPVSVSMFGRGQPGQSSTLLTDGRVLVAGGASPDSVLRSAELYDPATRRWSLGPKMPRARGDHAATLLPDGDVLLSGGVNFYGPILRSDLYHP